MMKIILIGIIFFVASGISNIVGFGTGTISIPLLLRFLPYDQTLLLSGIMQWLSGLWKMFGFFRFVQWKIAIVFGLPALITTVFSSMLIFIIPPIQLYQLFGLFLIIYCVLLITDLPVCIPRTWYYAVAGGIIYGFIAGIFGMRGPIRTIFLTAVRLPKREYIATSGAVSLLADISRLFVYLLGGVRLEPFLVKGMLLFIPATIAVAYLAQRLVTFIPQRHFEMAIAIFLGIIGVQLLLFGPGGR
jgi:uncharacterized membrane protein YfcA